MPGKREDVQASPTGADEDLSAPFTYEQMVQELWGDILDSAREKAMTKREPYELTVNMFEQMTGMNNFSARRHLDRLVHAGKLKKRRIPNPGGGTGMFVYSPVLEKEA